MFEGSISTIAAIIHQTYQADTEPISWMKGSAQRDSARFVGSQTSRGPDLVVIEDSLSIVLSKPGIEETSLGISMRTPGKDRELVVGFLYSEGIIESILDIDDIKLSPGSALIRLANSSNFRPSVHVRNTTVTSSCGICGRNSISNLLHMHGPSLSEGFQINRTIVNRSLKSLTDKQEIFKSTGGSHACARFDSNGRLIQVCEDVGRHNAMDKLIGSALIEGTIPILDDFLVVSGRASFELVQKSLRAGFPMMVSIGAPSTLAIDMANEHGMTLACFAREDSMTVYSGLRRIIR